MSCLLYGGAGDRTTGEQDGAQAGGTGGDARPTPRTGKDAADADTD
ncbi:hypothetical protein [Streptomonospora salina]